MRVGYLGGCHHLVHRGVLHAEGYVVEESVVEEYGLLVHVANEGSQVADAQFPHVGAVDADGAALHVVVAWQQVHQRTFAAAALPHQGDGLSALDVQVHVGEHLCAVAVAKVHVVKADFPLEGLQPLGHCGLLDGVFGMQNFVDALHRGHALRDVVGGF